MSNKSKESKAETSFSFPEGDAFLTGHRAWSPIVIRIDRGSEHSDLQCEVLECSVWNPGFVFRPSFSILWGTHPAGERWVVCLRLEEH